MEEMSGGARWRGVGRSSAADARGAGAEAARRALVGADPKLLIVFAAVGYDPAALAEGVAGAAPGVPVVGCSTNGEITPDGPGEGTVVVTAIGGARPWGLAPAAEGPLGGPRGGGGAGGAPPPGGTGRAEKRPLSSPRRGHPPPARTTPTR